MKQLFLTQNDDIIKMNGPRSILYLLLALALIRGVIYASVVPPWQAPDEPAHFERTRAALNADDWRGDTEKDPDWYDELTTSLFTFSFFDHLSHRQFDTTPGGRLNDYIDLYHEIYDGLYGSRPAYMIMGWPLWLADQQNISLQLYLTRLNTVLMNVVIVLLTYLTVRLIFPNDFFLAAGVPMLVVFNPQHTHMLSTVNNGNLAELLAATTFFFLVRSVIKGLSWFNAGAILIFALAAMWTKATAYFLPFVIGSVGLFYLWSYRRYWHYFLLLGTLLMGFIYVFAPERLRRLVADAWSLLQGGNIYLNPIVPQDLFRSFWAMPGWFNILLHPFWYQMLAIACVLALIGLVIMLVSKQSLLRSKEHQSRIQALVILAIAAVVAIGVLLSWNTIANNIIYRQGRSIYPVIIPISLFLTLGWRQLIPVRWRSIGLLAITLSFFLFDTLVLFHYVIPFFYSRY